MKKLLFVTGTRAEYGLLKNLILKLQADSFFEVHVAVTGTHLSKEHGYTYDLILIDQIKNTHLIPLEILGDRSLDLSNGIAKGLTGFANLLMKLTPDLMIVLGDRYELWSATMAATMANIPIAHIHGGESTEGLIDESVRHSITKMSHLHFCSHEHYRKRILRMGENPLHVWNVGAIGLDRIKTMKFANRNELENRLNTHFLTTNVLCTFHPVTLDENQSALEIYELLTSIEELIKLSSTKFFVSLPNSDTYSNHIRNAWDAFIEKYPENIYGFVNLGDYYYLSLMNEVDIILGNSSSGILEAPFLKKVVVDVGRRQEGRLRSKQVIHTEGHHESITQAIKLGLSSSFKELSKIEPSIYGDGNAVDTICSELKKIDLKRILFKKFYDGESL